MFKRFRQWRARRTTDPAKLAVEDAKITDALVELVIDYQLAGDDLAVADAVEADTLWRYERKKLGIPVEV